jgi:PAS domain S-box-containing protein
MVIAAVGAVLRESIGEVREDAFVHALAVNNETVLADETRVRSLLASLDKVILVLRSDFVANPKLTEQALTQRLNSLQMQSEVAQRASFANAAGDLVQTTAKKPVKVNVADRGYFKAQKLAVGDDLLVGDPVQSRITGEWVVPLTRRITRKDGTFGGMVILFVDPQLFSGPFEKTSRGENATRAILSLDGYNRINLNGGRMVYGGDRRTSQIYQEIKTAAAGSYTARAVVDGVLRSVSYRVINPYGIVILAGTTVESIENSYRDKVHERIIEATLFSGMILLLSVLLAFGVRRQAKLFATEQNFNQLIELVPQLVSSLDLQGAITWVNSRMVAYVGPTAAEQLAGFDWVMAAVHPDDLQRVKDFNASALLHHQNAQSCEYRKRRFDGEFLWFSSHIAPVHDEHGATGSYLQTGTDIHDRKMSEERTRVAQKMESIGQLTGGMAHDFNNLLAIIVGNLDLLVPEVPGETGARRLQVAIGAAQRGVGLVKSLLALASKQPLLPAVVELSSLVERITPLLRHALGQRVRFEVQLPETAVYVKVDEAGLEAVLLNLSVNARDAMPKGGDLVLRVRAAQGLAYMAITDNGTGMPAAVLKRATEPFFTTKERGHGTGLGLSMVAGFAKQSGGSMTIESTEGLGTTIEIALPQVLAPAPALPVQAIAPVAPAPAGTGPWRILVVDDEPEIASLVRDWLKQDGHTVVLAKNAADALTLLSIRAFDIMLTDIMMPGELDGIQLADRVQGAYPAVRILLMSGYSKETATSRADVPWPLLVKPFGKADFATAMDSLLRS